MNEGTTHYSYGTLSELKSVVKPDGTIIEYVHNANNQRVAKKVNGQITEKYLWKDLTTLLAVYDGNDSLRARFEYIDNRMPYKMTRNGQTYYLAYDQVGTLKAVMDENGTIVKTIEYDSFGNVLSDSNESLKVPFGFVGGLFDPDTKLTRFGYRDYDAETGKWTAKDPIGFNGGDTNLYGYVLGDPVNFVDINGLDVNFVIPIIDYNLYKIKTKKVDCSVSPSLMIPSTTNIPKIQPSITQQKPIIGVGVQVIIPLK